MACKLPFTNSHSEAFSLPRSLPHKEILGIDSERGPCKGGRPRETTLGIDSKRSVLLKSLWGDSGVILVLLWDDPGVILW